MTEPLAELVSAAAYGADCRYHGTDRGMTDAQLWADSRYTKDGKDYAERGHYRMMAEAALSVVSPLLAAKDFTIAELRDMVDRRDWELANIGRVIASIPEGVDDAMSLSNRVRQAFNAVTRRANEARSALEEVRAADALADAGIDLEALRGHPAIPEAGEPEVAG